MSHEIETIAWVGEVPWHGLGIEVTNEEDCFSIEKFIEHAQLNWEVELQQCYINIENIRKDVDSFATVRKSDNSVLGIVGPGYTVLQNVEAFKFFQPFLDTKLIRLNTAGSLFNGKRIWVLTEIVGEPIVIREYDVVRKFLLLSNSHDGTLAVRIGFTPIRVVCNNTLSMAHSSNLSRLLKIKHTKNISLQLENVQHLINIINTDFTMSEAAYKHLDEKSMDKEQLNNYIMNVFNFDKDSVVSTRMYNLLERIKSYFDYAPGAQGKTAWDAYNAITYYFSHECSNNQENRLNNLWFGTSVDVLKRALDLGLNYE